MIARRESIVLTMVGALALATAVQAQTSDAPPCIVSLDAIKGPRPQFSDYPVRIGPKVHPAHPVIATSAARLFRTRLREGAARGPDFADHFTVATWGCGSACVDWAIIDARSGRVSFIERLRNLSLVYADGDLIYRRESRLIVLLGAPHEDEAREGAAFFVWDGRRLNQVAFFPRRRSCAPAP